jgi:GAF domain-containing protein
MSISTNLAPLHLAGLSVPDFYKELSASLEALVGSESDGLAQLANACALIAQQLPHLNWVGFYLLKGGELVVGPFQGNPACTRIRLGKGVCGTAAVARQPIVVDDVDAFPGHIACDAASKSEFVAPLFLGDAHSADPAARPLVGVLDVDSPLLARFDAEHAAGLAGLADILSRRVHWKTLGLDATRAESEI